MQQVVFARILRLKLIRIEIRAHWTLQHHHRHPRSGTLRTEAAVRRIFYLSSHWTKAKAGQVLGRIIGGDSVHCSKSSFVWLCNLKEVRVEISLDVFKRGDEERRIDRIGIHGSD